MPPVVNGSHEPDPPTPGASLMSLVERQTEASTQTAHHLHELRRELGEQRSQLGTQSTHLGRLVELKEQERAEQAASAALRLAEAQADGEHRRKLHTTIAERVLYVVGGLAAAAGAYWFGTSGAP
jgi:hypothetical protein